MTSVDTARPQASVTLNPLRWRRKWLDMDRNEAVLRWAQTGWGQTILHVAFLGVLFLLPAVRTKHFVLIAIALVLSAVLPARRMAVLTAVGAVYFLLRPLKHEEHYLVFDELWTSYGTSAPTQIGFVLFGLVFIAFAAAMIRNQVTRKAGFIARRPIQFMLFLCVGLSAATIALPDTHPLFPPAWIFLAYLTGSFFFLGYILLDSRSKLALPIGQQLGFLRPVWAATSVPFKGPAYFRKFEAGNADELAISRLKALKLVVWATILYWAWDIVFNRILYGGLEFPQLDDAIAATAAGADQAVAVRWAIVGAAFLAQIIVFGAYIHAFVAVIRMAGFKVPRGMAKPLASRTISEFWGRYLFYFKELLADFFFYPAFQRYFKRFPRLRIAFATFAAAFVGNILFDVISNSPYFATRGFLSMIEDLSSYIIYAAVLTVGLIWSQIAQKRPKPEDGWWRYDVLPRVQVIVFYALLQVFDDTSGVVPAGERITFFFSLFGVTP
ncbi:hypothetical protein [Oricola cellulosilytica]|uniref:Uncharacterized protein n=1 Tax=Oricola cellulosilytica TaxID=1429082 RepID=A0A4R0PF55_9HYPH|nr:hypothetical protein [Oricola cellulosilytica]TCD16251.1 hypothetical protein E0D97_02125 [Oricola cellulosilytica]